jgi:hypothetical protein
MANRLFDDKKVSGNPPAERQMQAPTCLRAGHIKIQDQLCGRLRERSDEPFNDYLMHCPGHLPVGAVLQWSLTLRFRGTQRCFRREIPFTADLQIK